MISLAVYGIVCLLSFIEGKAEECIAYKSCLSDVEEVVITRYAETSNAFYVSPVSSGASASEVNNYRSSRMPVKRNQTGSFMIRSRVSINVVPRDMEIHPRMLLFPSGIFEAAHHLIGLRKLII